SRASLPVAYEDRILIKIQRDHMSFGADRSQNVIAVALGIDKSVCPVRIIGGAIEAFVMGMTVVLVSAEIAAAITTGLPEENGGRRILPTSGRMIHSCRSTACYHQATCSHDSRESFRQEASQMLNHPFGLFGCEDESRAWYAVGVLLGCRLRISL